MADAADTRGLLILFEPELTLSLLPTWWIEVPAIKSMNREYRGVAIDDVIFFDWIIARDGSVLGITFLPTGGLLDLGDRGMRAWLESLPYVDDAAGMPIVWFSENRDEDEDARVLQDFAAALYVTDAVSWGLALNINWLPLVQRDRLKEVPARWVDAECQPVEPGKGVCLCKGQTAASLYGLRKWFGSSEGRS